MVVSTPPQRLHACLTKEATCLLRRNPEKTPAHLTKICATCSHNKPASKKSPITMKVYCGVPTCEAQGFCSRQHQKYKSTTERQKKETDFFCCDQDVPPLVPRSKIDNGPLFQDTATAADCMPDECIIHILSYISSPQDLLKCSQLSKGIKNLLTTEMVVRTGMVYGGRSLQTLKKLLPLMEAGSINPPSAQRLLHLVNGCLCEFFKK